MNKVHRILLYTGLSESIIYPFLLYCQIKDTLWFPSDRDKLLGTNNVLKTYTNDVKPEK